MLIFVPWQIPPPAKTSARALTTAFFRKRIPAGTGPPRFSPQASRAANYSSLAPPSVISSLSIEPVPAAYAIVSVMPFHFPPVLPATNVAATPPVSTVRAISAGISTHAPTAMVPHIFLLVSHDVPPAAIASSAPVLLKIFSSAPIAPASTPVCTAFTVLRESSP